MNMITYGTGTAEDPWILDTPSLSSNGRPCSTGMPSTEK